MYHGIFIEAFYEVSDFMKANWNKNGPNIVVANGDVTGITYHADFVNGWDTQVLQDAIDKCASIDSVEARDCEVFKPSVHDHKLCKLEGQIPAEEVGMNGPIDKLPGCNPLWRWDGPAEHLKCKGAEPGYVTPNLDNRIRGTSFASPGANDTELMTRYRSPGLYQYNRWGSLDNRTTLPYLKPSTQEEVNAAANGGNKIAIIPGQVDSSSFTARTPASPPPASFAEGHGDRHINSTYICPDPASEPWHGLPCTTPGAGASAATGTPSGVLLATPQAPTAPAQDKPAVEVDGAAGGSASRVSTPFSASTTDKPPAAATGKPVGTATGNQPTGINGTGPAKVCQHKRRRTRQH